ncbi:40S ribosomal protein S30 [Ascochyta rabiei]|uniref:40S ribosomal protein S30 n=1 Tax=Didymella rabiei TaxID=5454 RepID=UPI002204AF24|nr:40S ribosomal protein S30 [Ascochyta rabiei]UPX16013.1 40S ribosomal protein S30 [Ascochyta rabiei]
MGKVHGSLARAGKVKSQTRKLIHLHPLAHRPQHRPNPISFMTDTMTTQDVVEPQEKKKTPKGRAKKRLTYTRRFVNVTMTGGKRKMNPNPTS